LQPVGEPTIITRAFPGEEQMAYPTGQHPGTTWHKTDFQCHTPRDLGWIGPSSLPGGTPADEAARDAWAAAFIAECVARGIAAVAITDHHDFAISPYIQRAGLASDPPVIVHPGIEITCTDDAQCLAVFDPACDSAVLFKLLGKLPGIMPAAVMAAKTCAIHPTTWTVEEVFAAVADDEHLRDVCLLFPHFSDGNAHKHLNKQGHHTRFAELNCDGVYTEKPFADLEIVTLDKAYGRIGEWGERRRAIVVTGDSRSDSWDKLGLHDCYIKLGEPTIEAVRQALLADEARIVYSRPEVPKERIVEVGFKSTLTGDDPVTITFNAGFNAFIGGRGSGKSALLEYLRFGLARTEKDLGHGGAAGREREEELIEHTLVDGYVVDARPSFRFHIGTPSGWHCTFAYFVGCPASLSSAGLFPKTALNDNSQRHYNDR
jgi:hypothetical protein